MEFLLKLLKRPPDEKSIQKLDENWNSIKQKLSTEKQQRPEQSKNGLEKTLEAKTKKPHLNKSKSNKPQTQHPQKSPSKPQRLLPQKPNLDSKDLTPELSNPLLDLFKMNSTGETLNGKLGKYVALDCEMVGVGKSTRVSILARVSIVNYNGAVIYDEYVAPSKLVTDYRYEITGIKASHLANAKSRAEVASEVRAILKGKIIIGHGLSKDLQVLSMGHPRKNIRDSAHYKPFIESYGQGKTPRLKTLVQQILGLCIQDSFHDSIEDARACMLIYRVKRKEWEDHISSAPSLCTDEKAKV